MNIPNILIYNHLHPHTPSQNTHLDCVMLHSCLVRVVFLLPTTHPHAMTPRSHSPYPPPKKNKKISEKGSAPTWMPPRGGGAPSQHDASRFTHNQGPHARHTATIRTAWSDALSIRSTPPNAARLCAKRPSVWKQRTTHQHTRQPMPRKALTWHHMAKTAHPQGKTAHPMQCWVKVAHPKRRRANRAFSFVSRII